MDDVFATLEGLSENQSQGPTARRQKGTFPDVSRQPKCEPYLRRTRRVREFLARLGLPSCSFVFFNFSLIPFLAVEPKGRPAKHWNEPLCSFLLRNGTWCDVVLGFSTERRLFASASDCLPLLSYHWWLASASCTSMASSCFKECAADARSARHTRVLADDLCSWLPSVLV